MVRAEDIEIIRKNARELGLSDSAFIKLCILIASQELKLKDDYSFKYSFLRWYKPKDLIEEIKKTEEKKVEKEERKIETKKAEEKKVEERITEEKKIEQPQPPRNKVKIQL
jgi:hypothetical protein